MFPYIYTPIGKISSFAVMIVIGILLFLFVVSLELKKEKNGNEKIFFIFPKIVYAFFSASVFAGVIDSMFKMRINNGFIIRGASFYGGLIGGVTAMLVMLRLSDEKHYTVKEWFDIMTLPLIMFHICGRLGCFFAGCCYGKETQSILGIAFPDNAEAHIFHYGKLCYPTQLFEVSALSIIFIIVRKTKEKFDAYILLYGITRFATEFFRGDERGEFFCYLSPAQIISIVCVSWVLLNGIKKYAGKHKPKA